MSLQLKNLSSLLNCDLCKKYNEKIIKNIKIIFILIKLKDPQNVKNNFMLNWRGGMQCL